MNKVKEILDYQSSIILANLNDTDIYIIVEHNASWEYTITICDIKYSTNLLSKLHKDLPSDKDSCPPIFISRLSERTVQNVVKYLNDEYIYYINELFTNADTMLDEGILKIKSATKIDAAVLLFGLRDKIEEIRNYNYRLNILY